MTHRQGVAGGRDIAARWCALAEQRLEHLTEMFETGRWRRYHSEIAFLENIQEAKRAVQTWRALAAGEALVPTSETGTGLTGWTPALSRNDERVRIVQPKAVHIASETAIPVELDAAPDDIAEISGTSLDEPPPAVPARVVEFTLSLDGIEAKYPLLRNTF